ncbi:hypothetical protein TH63_06895 [Rufibacter radiotolerans]|uniref:Uncharacterized protein n=1 Tax=Rufibacter radiotolerans TaxID=1379910 RepID=A0A0H4VI65_9BACT|nr:hypothetical protein [Rufibacter radiotolerans]AKQ45425.1 hypothetical protein TH63_06895 [Rufibacter radiotolerans]
MPLPFLQRSHVYAAHLLHKAGLTVSQIPQAVKIARETVELWLQKEMESGNAQQAMLVLKGHIQEKGPQLLLDRLKGMLLVKLMLHLGIRGALASNIVSLILPFVLKRVYDLARQNPRMQAWWQEQEWRERIPTVDHIKTRIRDAGKKLYPQKPDPANDAPLFI